MLVTGGAGYIGSVTVEALRRDGHHVEVLDDLSTGHRTSLAADVPFHQGSYADSETVEHVLRDGSIEALLHCGARSLVGESVTDPARYYRQNVAGGVGLLEGIRAAGVRRVVFSSSAAVYGVPESAPITEDAPLRPINTYGETKRIFEGALAAYASAYGFRSISLRYFNAAGASATNGELHQPETHLIPNVLSAAEQGTEVSVFGDDYPTRDGTCIRDYIHVEDLARAHVLALEATDLSDPRTGPTTADGAALAINLGTGHGFSVRDVIEAARGVVDRTIEMRTAPRRAGDPPVLVAAADRAAAVLGWRPEHSTLEEMIGSAWEWRRRNPDGYPD